MFQAEKCEKIRFAKEVLEADSAMFEKKVSLDPDLVAAVNWVSERCQGEVRRQRERVMEGIERVAALMRNRGDVERW